MPPPDYSSSSYHHFASPEVYGAPVSYAPDDYVSEADYHVPHDVYGAYAPSHYGYSSKSKVIIKGHKGHKGYKGYDHKYKAPKVKVVDKGVIKDNLNLLKLKKKYKLEKMKLI